MEIQARSDRPPGYPRSRMSIGHSAWFGSWAAVTTVTPAAGTFSHWPAAHDVLHLRSLPYCGPDERKLLISSNSVRDRYSSDSTNSCRAAISTSPSPRAVASFKRARAESRSVLTRCHSNNLACVLAIAEFFAQTPPAWVSASSST
jgi:hypothetical protein